MNINNISNTNNNQVITFINNTHPPPSSTTQSTPNGTGSVPTNHSVNHSVNPSVNAAVNQKVFVFQHPPESPPRGLAQCIASKPTTRSPSDGMLINQPLPQQRHRNNEQMNGMTAINGMVPINGVNSMNAMSPLNGERKINIFGADLPPLTAPTISNHSVMAKLEKDTKPKLEALTDSQSSSRNVDVADADPDRVAQPVTDPVPEPDAVTDCVPATLSNGVSNGVSDGNPTSNPTSNGIPNGKSPVISSTKRLRRRDARTQSESPRKLKRSRPNIPRLLSDEEVAAMHQDEDEVVMSHLSHLKHFCGGERVSLRHRFEAMFCDKWCSLELFDEIIDINRRTDSDEGDRSGDSGSGRSGVGFQSSPNGGVGNVKFHRCGACGKKYKYLCNLRSHAKVHTNEFGQCFLSILNTDLHFYSDLFLLFFVCFRVCSELMFASFARSGSGERLIMRVHLHCCFSLKYLCFLLHQ